MKSIEIAGETVDLLPGRALYWRAAHTLVIADLHLGKADCMRRAGIAIPRGTTASDLARLQQLLVTTGARELVVLGDFIHAAPSRQEGGTATQVKERTWVRDFAAWRAGLDGIRVTMVAGNHDRGFVAPGEWHIEQIDGPAWRSPFRFAHYPPVLDPLGNEPPDLEADPRPGGSPDDRSVPTRTHSRDPAHGAYTLAGHVHPAIRLRAHGEGARLACFVVGNGSAILPAFSTLVGWGDVTPTRDERCFVIAGDTVVETR